MSMSSFLLWDCRKVAPLGPDFCPGPFLGFLSSHGSHSGTAFGGRGPSPDGGGDFEVCGWIKLLVRIVDEQYTLT